MIESHSLSDYLFGIASEAANRGEYKKALHYLEQVLIMNPRHTRAWCIKGHCLYHLGKCKEALHSYYNAIELDPGNSDGVVKNALNLKESVRKTKHFYCTN